MKCKINKLTTGLLFSGLILGQLGFSGIALANSCSSFSATAKCGTLNPNTGASCAMYNGNMSCTGSVSCKGADHPPTYTPDDPKATRRTRWEAMYKGGLKKALESAGMTIATVEARCSHPAPYCNKRNNLTTEWMNGTCTATQPDSGGNYTVTCTGTVRADWKCVDQSFDDDVEKERKEKKRFKEGQRLGRIQALQDFLSGTLSANEIEEDVAIETLELTEDSGALFPDLEEQSASAEDSISPESLESTPEESAQPAP